MPPEPVTGLCILPRVPMISSTSARTAAPSPPCFSASCRKLAASRLSRSTADPHLVRRRSRAERPGATRPAAAHPPARPPACRPTVRRHAHHPHEKQTAVSAVLPEILRSRQFLDRRFSSIVDATRSPTQEARVTDRTARPPRPASRTNTGAARWSSPTGPGSPAGATSPASSGSPPSGSGSTASRTSSSSAPSSATCVDERFYADLDDRPAAPGHHVDAGPAADDQHDGARPARPTPRRSTPTRSGAT